MPQATTTRDLTRKVPLPTKLIFGIGQGAESIKNFGFGTLLLLYYNQVLGLSGTYSGIAIAIALTADAISDPAVGSWSDGIKSRLGRRHPFMYASAVPMGICFYLLFMPPEGLSEFQLFLWFTTFCVLTRTALTFFHVPYLSLGAELTQNYQDRTTIVVIRTAIGLLSSLAIVAIAWNFFFIKTEAIPNPQLTREPYYKYAFLSSLVMTAMMLVCTWGTQREIPNLAGSSQEARKFSLMRVYTDLYLALQNQSFRALFFGALLLFIYLGIHGALSMHLKTFYWQLDTKGIQYWQYGAILGGVVGLPLVPILNRLVDKKWTVIIGCFSTAIAGTGPVVLNMFGLMPTDPDMLVTVLVAAATLGSVAGISAGVTSASMMGDIADEHELAHGIRQEGIFFGSFNFSTKCTSALGNLFAGFALDIISFPVNSTPGNVAEEVLWRFGLIYIVVVFVIVISTWAFWAYNLDKKRHAEVLVALSRRHNQTTDSLDEATGSVRTDA